MQTLVVYFSKFGNTQSVAETIAEELDRETRVRVLSPDKLTASEFEAVDLVIMGTPTHNMNLPKSVKSVFEILPCRSLLKTPIATFDTSY